MVSLFPIRRVLKFVATRALIQRRRPWVNDLLLANGSNERQWNADRFDLSFVSACSEAGVGF